MIILFQLFLSSVAYWRNGMAAKLKFDEEKIAQELMRRIEKRCKNQLLYADKMLEQEFKKLYEQIIDQYYTYVTQYYYRHDVGKGTGNGVNLYRASNMRMENGSGRFDDNFIFGLDDSELHTKKYKTTAEQVLENVMDGWRRTSHDYTGWYSGTTTEEIKTDKNGNPYYVSKFTAKVEFCGMSFSGTPNEIIDQIDAAGIVEQYRFELFMKAINNSV